MTSTIKTVKVLLVGDGATGKTALVKRHRTGEFDQSYKATMGMELHPIKFHTNHGPIIFNVWDCAGQEKFRMLKDGYYIQGQAAIVVFDHQNKLSLKNTDHWHLDVWRVCEDIPMVLCGNKSDLGGTFVPSKEQEDKYLAYHSVSVKTNQGYEKPFLTLAKHFLGDDTEFCHPEWV